MARMMGRGGGGTTTTLRPPRRRPWPQCLTTTPTTAAARVAAAGRHPTNRHPRLLLPPAPSIPWTRPPTRMRPVGGGGQAWRRRGKDEWKTEREQCRKSKQRASDAKSHTSFIFLGSARNRRSFLRGSVRVAAPPSASLTHQMQHTPTASMLRSGSAASPTSRAPPRVGRVATGGRRALKVRKKGNAGAGGRHRNRLRHPQGWHNPCLLHIGSGRVGEEVAGAGQSQPAQ